MAVLVLSAACDDTPGRPTGLSVSSLSPNTGETTGATRVTLAGVGFRSGATVSFGGVAANATVTDSTRIVVSTPAHAAGLVDVVVTNPNGQEGSLKAAYRYGAEPTFTISGDVTEATESGPRPVAGAVVMELSTRGFALTAEDGSYSLAGLRAMNTSVSVSKAGFLTQTTPLTLTGDTRLDMVISRPRTYVLSGLVYEVTAAGRVPIDGVVLYCDACGSPGGHTFVTTDAEGLYSFSWVSPGVTYLQVIGKAGFKYEGPIQSLGIPIPTNGDTRFDIELVRR
jgi:hypothetical protein